MPHINDPLLQAYIDGFCGDARVAEIEAHVAECAECRARLETAQGAAARASKLLGSLEPGPIHEPSFEDLKERAVTRSTEGAIDPAAALELARAATANVGKGRPPLWRRPALAWAATVIIAFAVGWMTRSGIDLPTDMRPSPSVAAEPQSPESRFGDVGRDNTAAGRRGQEAGEQAAQDAPAGAEAYRQRVPVDERDDAAAKATVADNLASQQQVASEPAAAPPVGAVAEGQALPRTAAEETVGRREEVAQPTAPERRQVSADQQPVAVTGASPLVDVDSNERAAALGGMLADADSEVAQGFVAIDRAELEPWLGAAPRELPEMALLRVEVGPGALLDNGVAGRNAARLIYWARGGEEIVLTQQYLGSPPQPRPSGDLPALVSEPGGPATYTWLDDDGYLLSVSAMLEPDIVRQIAGLVR